MTDKELLDATPLRKMYILMQEKASSPRMTVLADDREQPITSAYYLDLENAIAAWVLKTGKVFHQAIFVQYNLPVDPDAIPLTSPVPAASSATLKDNNEPS